MMRRREGPHVVQGAIETMTGIEGTRTTAVTKKEKEEEAPAASIDQNVADLAAHLRTEDVTVTSLQEGTTDVIETGIAVDLRHMTLVIGTVIENTEVAVSK